MISVITFGCAEQLNDIINKASSDYFAHKVLGVVYRTQYNFYEAFVQCPDDEECDAHGDEK